jgi:hypothetical protein
MPFMAAFSQQVKEEKAEVLFDPLFWKEDLKLSFDQCQKIKNINYEFFQRIHAISSQERVLAPSKAAELLSDRSEKIWSTFQPRQKKKWKKMMATQS